MNSSSSITGFARSLSQSQLTREFDGVRCQGVYRHRLSAPASAEIARDPRSAGLALHKLFARMDDNLPLTSAERAYLPWMSALRAEIRGHGATRFKVEEPMRAGKLKGYCDLVGRGPGGVRIPVEVKSLRYAVVGDEPRGRDLAQLAAYSLALELEARSQHKGSPARPPAISCLAYAELSSAQLTMMVFDLHELAAVAKRVMAN